MTRVLDARMKRSPTGKGLMGWLGRQVGYVRNAIKSKPADVIYREGRIEEADHPNEPGVTLRRTTIDEVVFDRGRGAADPSRAASRE